MKKDLLSEVSDLIRSSGYPNYWDSVRGKDENTFSFLPTVNELLAFIKWSMKNK